MWQTCRMINRLRLKKEWDGVSFEIPQLSVFHNVAFSAFKGEVKCRLSDGSRPIPELLWLDGNFGENNGHLLLALHLPSTLILWDTGSGQQVWKKSFAENFRGFDVDPFDDSRVLLRCNDCILFLSDFSTSKCPSGNGKKFYISGKNESFSVCCNWSPGYNVKLVCDTLN